MVGLLVFWPSGDEEAKAGQKDGAVADKRGSKGGAAGAKGAAARGGGGVGARSVDDATPGTSAKGKVNPRLLPKRVGMAPSVPAPEPPPKFNNVDEEIAWYEKKLEIANGLVASRQKGIDRLPRAKQRAEDSEDPTKALAKYEASKKIVESNFAKAQAKVSDIEKKLAELRGE